MLCGYAGTGKTTMLRLMVEKYRGGGVVCVAPTNKAVDVLRSKMPEGTRCMTAHSLTKRFAGKEYDSTTNLISLEFAAKGQAEVSYDDLIICDESSMVALGMARELLNNCGGARVIFVGDSAQLPPISGNSIYTQLQPDYTLTNIVRQAAGSEIAEYAAHIRNGIFDYQPQKSKTLFFQSVSNINYWKDAKQVLCGTHKTRKLINQRIRAQLGFTGILPNVGERLVCIKANTEKTAFSHGTGLINGAQATCLTVPVVDARGRLKLSLGMGSKTVDGITNIANEPFHAYSAKISNEWQLDDGAIGLDFAYALTVHKAQGSEWDYGIFVDDWKRTDPSVYARFAYTGVTRFKQSLVVAT